ncbi:MAG: hypothetical protein LUG66_08630 [Clostridiales bacterium]|nr:hypothetical protein [Clostridiales bacterium]
MKHSIIAALIISAFAALNAGAVFGAEKPDAVSSCGSYEDVIKREALRSYSLKGSEVIPELIPVYPNFGYSYDQNNTFLYPFEGYKSQYL